MKINKAEFVTGAADVYSIPRSDLPEVAIAGRSNVGKSSLINRLLNRKRLAVTSSTPGRTRQINFFNINDEFYIVDLPGYGYAKVSKGERRKWGEVVSAYMRDRRALKAMVVIIDLRRDARDEEFGLMEMLDELGIPPIVVLTKADKVKRNERARRRAAIAKAFDMSPSELVVFSSVTGEGKAELWKAITAHLGKKVG